jgi:ATP-dependent Lon protease
MLDEIDKLGKDFRGDPSSALLEALDPEQNYAFSDHYLEVKYDLSKILFITTANIKDPIPPALRDRLEMIRFSGYTPDEKLNIAKQFLIKKQREEHGLKYTQIKFTDGAINKIIYDYTFEAGVRNLEREIANVTRGVTTKVVKNELSKTSITARNIRDYLGREKVPPPNKVKKLLSGMCPVLFVTGHGGTVGYVEAVLFDGAADDEIILTGQLGEVMQESAIIAFNHIRTMSNKITIPDMKEKVIHIHVPEGATPKDGPSAGIALFCALVSLFNNKTIRKGITMSGEITLKGDVLPIGGVKEKVIGAHRAGMTEIILPAWNERDLDDVPKEILDDVEFYFVENASQVLDVVF